MSTVIYVEFNVFCIFILCYILYEMSAHGGGQLSMVAYRRVVVNVLLALAVDCIWMILNGMPGLFPRILEYIVNVAAATQYALVCWYFNAFVMTQTGEINFRDIKDKRHALVFGLPVIGQFVMAAVSVFTGWYFVLDEANRYRPGILYVLQLAVPVFYLADTALKLRRAIWLSENRQAAQKFYVLLSFVIFPLVGGVLTVIFNDIPSVWPMCVISLLIVFASLQKQQISTDGLTGLNNRAKFDSFLSEVIKEKIEPMRLYLFLMDVNSFKLINDQFGHYEGDQALRETSEVLKNVGQDYDIFLARYGGDEFAIIAKLPNPLLIDNICNQIRGEFRRRNEAHDRPYDLMLSIGVAEFVPDASMSISDLIANADHELYADKARSKAGRNEAG